MENSKVSLEVIENSDPYADGIVAQNLKVIKKPICARAVGILTNSAKNRNMDLIASSSRAVRLSDVHELVCTGEFRKPSEVVRDISYLSFIVFEESGVLAIGDQVEVDGKVFGKILGFNEIHAPNHINIVIRVLPPITGYDAKWKPGMKLRFVRNMETPQLNETE
jgi:hypothetical protein